MITSPTAYISSTFKDLKEHREAVHRALRRLQYQVICMEDYVATDQRNVDKCRDHAANCDIYIGIFGNRYGYIPTQSNPSGLSITELEYRAARASQNTHVRVFLLDNEGQSGVDDVEDDTSRAKLASLRNEIAQVSYGPFKDIPELVEQVLASVYMAEAQERVQAGLDLFRLTGSTLPLENSGLPMIIADIGQAISTLRPLTALRLNLDTQWWSTRLYLVAALLEEYTPIRQILFTSFDMAISGGYRYFGMCSPTDVRHALASAFPDIDKAYRESVPPQVFDAAGQAPVIVSTFASKVKSLAPGGESEVKQIVGAHAIRQWRGFHQETVELEGRRFDGALVDEVIRKTTPYVAVVRGGRFETLIDRIQMATNLALRWRNHVM